MIKTSLLTLILGLLINSDSLCQGSKFCMDKCGMDDVLCLNENEAQYFNLIFNDIKGAYDFSSKKVVFGEGFLGKNMVGKSLFFKRNGHDFLNHLLKHNEIIGGIHIIILNDDEKEITDMFDVIIIFGSKAAPTISTRKQIIKDFNRKLK